MIAPLALLLALFAHDPEGRLAEVNAALAADPGSFELRLKRGDLHRQLGHTEAALRDAQWATETRPLDARAWWLGGAVLAEEGRSREALAWLMRYQTLDELDGEAWRMRSILLERLGAMQPAAEAAERALELLERVVPEDYLRAARLRDSLGEPRKAIKILEQGIERLGVVVSLLDAGVALSVRQEDWKLAASWALALHESAPRHLPWKTQAEELAAKVKGKVRAPRWTSSDSRRSELEEAPSADRLVPMGSIWKYFDEGEDLGTAWREKSFRDSRWKEGPAQLGYGDGDEATVLSFGKDAEAKFITTYFRHEFQVNNPSQYRVVKLHLLRDDGAAVYLNEKEVIRSGLAEGELSASTVASSTASGASENTYFEFELDPSWLEEGTNLLAVEVHQRSLTSSDISFDLELEASTTLPELGVSRGPYLQLGTASSAVVRWRTNRPSESHLWLGAHPSQLSLVASASQLVTEHIVELEQLEPATRYYYAVGNEAGPLAGADEEHYFQTSPEPGAKAATRIWVIGDSGTADANARAVRDSYLNLHDAVDTDVWLMLGDNAYNDGTDAEYQAAMFEMYPQLLRRAFVWPTLGNHDGRSASSEEQSGVYYDIFSLPTGGEAGGLASGTEAYYSFDYGNVHFVCLDSHHSDRDPSGAMLTWLQADLANTQADWVIAYWHHPPYTKGSHDSDNDGDSGGRMRDMREGALPILEAAGVDLVLSGHSHSYERSKLIGGHYGPSESFRDSMVLDGASGDPAETASYHKATLGLGPHEGAVYSVVGCSGLISGGPLDHPAMRVSINRLGSMVIDVEGSMMHLRFLSEQGEILDQFAITKGEGPFVVRDSAAVSATRGGTQNLYLEAGVSAAGCEYYLMGSSSRTPGFSLNGTQVSLNRNFYYARVQAQANTSTFQNARGILDDQGRAKASLTWQDELPAAFSGLRLFHAAVVIDGASVVGVTDPVSLLVLP